MSFINYAPTRGGLKPGSAKLTRTHLILSPDLLDKLNSTQVSVAYDPEIQTFKLGPVDSGGLKITDGKIQSKGFCNYFGITKRGLFNAKWEEDDRAIYITLNESTHM